MARSFLFLTLASWAYLLPFSLFAQDKLIVISPHWEGIKTEFSRAFGKWYSSQTGRSVTMDWRDMGGATDDLRFIISEFQQTPDSIGIDVFFGGGMDPFVELKQRNYLEAFKPPSSVMDEIPKEIGGLPIYDPEGEWYGTALSSFGILKNKKVVEEMQLPDVNSWRDLMQPALKGWVGSGDPRNSGSTHMVYESILQTYGWEEGWKVILGIAANIRQFDRSAGSAAKACSLGNVAYSLVVDFYGFTQIAEVGEKNMEIIFPKGESILTPDSIALLKGAPNRAVGEKFIEFVLSDAGQRLWLAPKGHPLGPKKFAIERMSVRPKLYEELASVTLVKVNPFRDLHPFKYDSNRGSLRWGPLNLLMGATIIDRPPERRLRRMILSEDELNRIAKNEWKDPVLRSRLQLEWQKTD